MASVHGEDLQCVDLIDLTRCGKMVSCAIASAESEMVREPYAKVRRETSDRVAHPLRAKGPRHAEIVEGMTRQRGLPHMGGCYDLYSIHGLGGFTGVKCMHAGL